MKTQEKVWNEKIALFVNYYGHTKPYNFSKIIYPEGIVEFYDFVTHYDKVIVSGNEKDALLATLNCNTGLLSFSQNDVSADMEICLRIESFIYCNGKSILGWDMENVNLALEAWKQYMALTANKL